MTSLPRRALVSWVRWAGGALLVAGLLGLFRGQFTDFFGHEGVPVFGFTGNPLTHLLHFAAGVTSIAVLGSLAATRRTVFFGGLALTAFGLLEFVLGDGTADIFGRNARMAVFVLVLGILGLLAWLWERSERTLDGAEHAPSDV